jgi:L-Ala-D/L-Glu epimerase / N-acetyl-D-glutamate racemase
VKTSVRIVRLELEEPFTISRGTETEVEVVQVEIQHGGQAGLGEGAPIERYDESAESALDYVHAVEEKLGEDPFALDEIFERLPREQFAARAAIDGALHDLCGKLVGLPTWRMLGLRRVGPPTSWTITLGEPDAMAAAAARASDGRFKRLKLKLGGWDGRDVERVRAIRGATRLPLQVDVNEAWSAEEALDALPQLAELGVQYCEQPLAAGDAAGPEVKRRSPLPIYVDEDCHTLDDVALCADRGHGINIKLAKSGGIREAMRMAHAARALGLDVMLGCMVESGLGIAAGCVVASVCDHVDLDGNLLLAEDPCPGVELVNGVQLPPDSPGLGVHAEALSGSR